MSVSHPIDSGQSLSTQRGQCKAYKGASEGSAVLLSGYGGHPARSGNQLSGDKRHPARTADVLSGYKGGSEAPEFDWADKADQFGGWDVE